MNFFRKAEEVGLLGALEGQTTKAKAAKEAQIVKIWIGANKFDSELLGSVVDISIEAE